MKHLYKIENADLPQCTEVLARSFRDYPMYKYILGQQQSQRNIEATVKFFLTYAFRYANAYATSPNLEGIVGFVDYEKYKMNPFRFLRCNGFALARLGSEIGKRYGEYDQFNTKIHKEIVDGPHQYIMFVGVDPDKQGQGLASQLLRPVLELAEANGKPSYLETHNQRNVEIYRRYGFRLAGEHPLPNSDIIMYSMLRPATGTQSGSRF